MIVQMDSDLFDLYRTGVSARYRDVSRNAVLRDGFKRAIDLMKVVVSVEELRGFSYLHYEKLKHQYSGLSSVRLSNRFVHRLIFEEIDGGINVKLIEIDDTHYGNK